MGCDIHAYIEHVLVGDDEGSKGFDGYVFSLTGKFSLPRDYLMFSLMAGVRAYGDEKPLFEPRGLPKKLGHKAEDDYYLRVDDEQAKLDVEGVCSRDKADYWIKSGFSQALDDGRVTDPDYHTPSWLTTDEFAKCVKKGGRGLDSQYQAALASMQAVEADGLHKARIVFWFDN
jgi:hypothetical protein